MFTVDIKQQYNNNKFELMGVNYSARAGGITGISIDFLSHECMLRVLIRITLSRYSRTSVARTLMARLPWLFRTRS